MKPRRARARALMAIAVLVLVAGLSPVAGAEPTTEQQLRAAKQEFNELKRQIEAQNQDLERLQAESAQLAQRVEEATARWEQITEELHDTRQDLGAAQAEFSRLQQQLDDRIRETFITGPGSGFEFILGATSMADLSARVEYMNALNDTDADLAAEVQNVKNALQAEKDDQERLQARAAEALRQVQVEQAALDAKLAEQQAILDSLEGKEARAAELVEKLGRRYERELEALSGVQFFADEVFKVCPVAQPRAVYDGFGAPRYSGGYHPHAGNDIIAPQGTQILATFDGYARASTNGLGGYTVYVEGELGYTYNAHMMQPGYTGPVSAGDVIGYVGETGNTNTNHNHFEWHPSQTPDSSSWPASPYGYSVIDSSYGSPAVNPWPILAVVC